MKLRSELLENVPTTNATPLTAFSDGALAECPITKTDTNPAAIVECFSVGQHGYGQARLHLLNDAGVIYQSINLTPPNGVTMLDKFWLSSVKPTDIPGLFFFTASHGVGTININSLETKWINTSFAELGPNGAEVGNDSGVVNAEGDVIFGTNSAKNDGGVHGRYYLFKNGKVSKIGETEVVCANGVYPMEDHVLLTDTGRDYMHIARPGDDGWKIEGNMNFSDWVNPGPKLGKKAVFGENVDGESQMAGFDGGQTVTINGQLGFAPAIFGRGMIPFFNGKGEPQFAVLMPDGHSHITCWNWLAVDSQRILIVEERCDGRRVNTVFEATIPQWIKRVEPFTAKVS